MKNVFIIIFINLGFTAFTQTTASISITVPSYALLDIAPNNTAFNLNLVAPTEAGNISTINPANSTKWINFTSAVAPGITRRITAQVSGALPNGLNLKLIVANYAGAGAGTTGTSSGTIFLSGTAQTVINGIGGAFTGDGINNGYNLKYSVEIVDYSLLKAQSNTFSIIYTLIDN
jgi:hypothetical protein